VGPRWQVQCNVGVILSSLGLAASGVSSDAYWQSRDWQYEQSTDTAAVLTAQELMRQRADTWKAFGASSVGEVLSIAQRDVRTQLLYGALADQDFAPELFERIALKGLSDSPEAISRRVRMLPRLVSAAVRRGIEDSEFRAVFESAETIRARWPVEVRHRLWRWRQVSL
jgi:hypothetical protein